MKKKILLLLTCALTQYLALGQQKLTLNYYYSDSTESRHDFYFSLIPPVGRYPDGPTEKYKLEHITTDQKDGLNHTRCTFFVADTNVCLLFDGFGHEIFTLPGDEINVYFTKMPKTNGHWLINDKFPSPYVHNVVYEGKNKYYYSLFDSLAYYTGSLIMGSDIKLKQTNYILSAFFDTVTYRYRQRLNYLQIYSSRYHLPASLQKLAVHEIKAAYVNNLLAPITNPQKDFDQRDYPKAYIDSLNAIDFDDPQYFFKTPVFNSTAFRYEYLYHNRSSLKGYNTDENFTRTYNTINTHYTSSSIKEWLLAAFFNFIFEHNNNQECKSCDSLLSDFATRFPESKYQKYIDSCYSDYKKVPTATLKDMLTTTLIDDKGNSFTIADLLKNKPLIIDCWASWCIPCLKELPYSAEFQKKYSGKATVIYLSFDRDKNRWLDKAKAISLTDNSYLVEGNFRSALGNYFNITTIPRYIIFDNKGGVVNKNAPRPSRKEALTKIMDELTGVK